MKFVPLIPKIACHSPHICVFCKVLCIFDFSRTGRERKHHISAAVVNSFSNHFNFIICAVRRIPLAKFRYRNVVALYKINAPLSIKFKYAVIIILCTLTVFHSVHIGVPRAYAEMVRNLTGSKFTAFYFCIFVHCLTWNTTHNMNSEF